MLGHIGEQALPTADGELRKKLLDYYLATATGQAAGWRLTRFRGGLCLGGN